MKDYTDITVLLDRSGSMTLIKADMEQGFAAFIEGHKTVPSTRLTLMEFDDPGAVPPVTFATQTLNQYNQLPGFLQSSAPTSRLSLDVRYTARPISEAPPLVMQPRGWTPLVDSLCTSIDQTGARLRSMKEADRPARVLFVIITDGGENASYLYSREQARARITHQTEAYKWEFVYLGANQDAIAEAQTLGITFNKALDYQPSSVGTANALQAMTVNTVAYSQTGTLSNVSNEQRVTSSGTDTDLLKKAATLTSPTK